ncbi:hypothetical protein B0J13DRAFT_520230 [Dactylonectria estremocensis]|uniref:Uncharacterized protein n=1 Tax=Dactylonectria estremocensis TaxID=1079267 RepID=A0A9P9FB71_9HYPO|nr:hypothetical protein B0J13DRAFT_520230 [Dactylonectria estremocensis]
MEEAPAHAPIAASQANSHSALEPISASVLADREARRRDAATALGSCRTGCADLDDYVLLGGFERGSIVGLSAEDEEMGVKLGLQTLVHSLCGEGSVTTGLVITPKPASAILGGLRDAVRAELRHRGTAQPEFASRTRECLERVMLSCVFDLDGLWEVLADLDRPADCGMREESREGEGSEEDQGQEAEKGNQEKMVVDEIGDSQEDEDDELADAQPQFQPQPEPKQQTQPQLQPQSRRQQKPEPPPLPDLIIITHFSALLTSLFTHREKSAAHAALQLLGSHLRVLTRNLASSPLVLLLNSTSSAADKTKVKTPTAPLDATLRSIFNPPPTPGYVPHAGPGPGRRSKPSFGLVFAQLLDLHLLCTRIPRNRGDAEAAATALHGHGAGVDGAAAAPLAAAAAVDSVWLTEVLLDDLGVWEGRKGARRDREQRWTAVDVEGARIRDAFLERERMVEPVRLAGGFGGRRE